METLGKWLIAGAILCIIGIFGSGKDKDSSEMKVCLFIISLVLGIVGYNCVSKDNSDYPHGVHGSHGEWIHFDSRMEEEYYIEQYSCNAYFANGNYACEVKVKSKNGVLYAFPNGDTHGHQIENAPYDTPRPYYIYWANTPIYFSPPVRW